MGLGAIGGRVKVFVGASTYISGSESMQSLCKSLNFAHDLKSLSINGLLSIILVNIIIHFR